MHIDILLVPFGATAPAMLQAAVVIEQEGFDGVWTWDHLRSTDGPAGVPESWTTLTAIAATVPRIIVGPLVANVVNRHPAVLANMAATLQQLSAGRLLLGMGAGGGDDTPYAEEQHAIGQPVGGDAERRERVVEAIQVIKRLWSGDASSFQGTHYQLDHPEGYLRPIPAPPIIVGGFGPRIAAIAGRYADGINLQAFSPRLPELVSIARREHESSGRDPSKFIVTVFAGMQERWLRADSRDRQTLDRLGVQRLILLVQPPYNLDTIRRAGALLHG